MAESGFTEEQKQYLQGFLAGLANLRPAGAGAVREGSPEAIHSAAQDRFIAAGRKLVAEEEAKRAKDPFAMWDEIGANAAADRFPKGTDIFLHKFHGLFYVAPAQNAFMCRLRFPAGIVTARQLAGLADIAERLAGGYADITTRANLQLREIPARNAQDLLIAIDELGLTSRGAGADNIRNVTASPTAGIDRQELIDTRPLARALHHYILNHRELYGLPRKFNIAFDGGGSVSVLEDTNDIGFAAVALDEGHGVPPGIYFRVLLGGITGHGDFARDSGLLLTPEQCVPVAVALVRVFIDHGDRTDRKKARLKYLLDQWGIEKYLAEAAKHLAFQPQHLAPTECRPRPPAAKHGHIGVHAQRQPGLNFIGVAVPVGRLGAAQMRGLAAVAERFGSGTLRLTVWQNLLISDVPDADLAAAGAAIAALGLGISASAIRGALVACTGNTGCKFALGNTKRHALELADHLEARLALDQPITIHLTGCPHSCAQHLVADIGLLATKVEIGDELVEGYNVCVGGAGGAEPRIGREIYPAVPFADVPRQVERLLGAYLAHRVSPAESFGAFANRHALDELKRLCETAVSQAA